MQIMYMHIWNLLRINFPQSLYANLLVRFSNTERLIATQVLDVNIMLLQDC